jgi:hypothetical protein
VNEAAAARGDDVITGGVDDDGAAFVEFQLRCVANDKDVDDDDDDEDDDVDGVANDDDARDDGNDESSHMKRGGGDDGSVDDATVMTTPRTAARKSCVAAAASKSVAHKLALPGLVLQACIQREIVRSAGHV